VTFYNDGAGTSFEDGYGSVDGFGLGLDIYGGTQSNPVFAPGTFALYDFTFMKSGVLTISGAPEPAAWSMMLLGFGLLGAALRARKRAPAKA
jgi:hypothetical protein